MPSLMFLSIKEKNMPFSFLFPFNIVFNLEFVMATINRQRILSKESLQKAFKLFDKVRWNILFS